MYRSLIDFSSRSFEVYEILHMLSLFDGRCRFSADDNHQIGGLTLFKAKRSHVISTPLQPTEISVDVVSEQHPTPQISHHDSCANTNTGVFKTPRISGVYDDVECGIKK
jgi:hypothetical protein